MSSTINNLHANINIKIKELLNILEIYNKYTIDTITDKKNTSYYKDLLDIQAEYNMESVSLLYEYHNGKSNYDQYIKYINSKNIINILDSIFNFCKKINNTYEINNKELEISIEKCNKLPLDDDFIYKNQNICSCGKPFKIDSDNSEFVCQCGLIEKVHGLVFEVDQFFYQEGNRTKHQQYEPIKHGMIWMERIEGTENKEIPDEVIIKIKNCIKRDKIWLDDIYCETIRKYLKECNHTEYNNHASLIRKKITNTSPYKFTDQEKQIIIKKFALVIQVYNKIKDDNSNNCPYLPYFFYKIIEHILKSNKDSDRRKYMLSAIHLQSEDTLIKADRKWKLICDELKDFKYTTTRKNNNLLK